jgi:hypothetical protein
MRSALAETVEAKQQPPEFVFPGLSRRGAEYEGVVAGTRIQPPQAYVIRSVAVDPRVSNVVDVPNYVVSALCRRRSSTDPDPRRRLGRYDHGTRRMRLPAGAGRPISSRLQNVVKSWFAGPRAAMHPPAMFVVTESAVTVIRSVLDQGGERSACSSALPTNAPRFPVIPHPARTQRCCR